MIKFDYTDNDLSLYLDTLYKKFESKLNWSINLSKMINTFGRMELDRQFSEAYYSECDVRNLP